MSKSTLQTSPEYPESEKPAHIQTLARPAALHKASKLAFLRFEKPDLAESERFWHDFGLAPVKWAGDELVMRTAGTSPAALVATKGPKPRFVGAAFEVPSDADFGLLKREHGAKDIPNDKIPGGGRGVELRDPDGNAVWLIADWGKLAPLPTREPIHPNMNTLVRSTRVNATVRAPLETAGVGRLGHFVLQTTDFAVMADWYMRHLGIIPTDVQYLVNGEPLLAFFRLNLGQTPADHHTVVIASGLENRYEHSAWEVVDLDALGQGQQVLLAQGHRHMWGIGRHLLGSQLFDYWYDPDGFEFEHYTDGDVFTENHETHYVPFSKGSIWAWGDDAPPTMFPARTPAMLLRVVRLMLQGRLSAQKLKALGKTLAPPARPWL